MRESSYINSYLADNDKYLWTPQTYLHYTLRGKAKDYSGGYHRALMRAINRRMASGEVIAVRSARGSTAYIWSNAS